MAADSDVKVPPLSSAASFISFGKKKKQFFSAEEWAAQASG